MVFNYLNDLNDLTIIDGKIMIGINGQELNLDDYLRSILQEPLQKYEVTGAYWQGFCPETNPDLKACSQVDFKGSFKLGNNGLILGELKETADRHSLFFGYYETDGDLTTISFRKVYTFIETEEIIENVKAPQGNLQIKVTYKSLGPIFYELIKKGIGIEGTYLANWFFDKELIQDVKENLVKTYEQLKKARIEGEYYDLDNELLSIVFSVPGTREVKFKSAKKGVAKYNIKKTGSY